MTSGLTGAARDKAVKLTLQAAILGYHNRDRMHYTQGTRRWEGIDREMKAYQGHYPNHADCSAFVTWCLWNGLNHFHKPDVVNREHWEGGYTGTMLDNGRAVASPIPCDAIIYGHGGTGEHTAIFTGGGLVVSFGSEPGPLLLPMRYRTDIMSIRRYI